MHLSFTGVDDKTSIDDLVKLTSQYGKYIRFGVLYMPEKEGQPRYPSESFRRSLTDEKSLTIDAHLCGQKIFRMILDEDTRASVIDDLKNYSRVQLNINAFTKYFSDDEVELIYDTLIENDIKIIVQMNDGSKNAVEKLLNKYSEFDQELYVLNDSSKGLGKSPDHWPKTISDKAWFGFAGGLSPDNIKEQFPLIAEASNGNYFWVDMESGVRDENNEFSLEKVNQVAEYIDSDLRAMLYMSQ